MHAPTLAAVSLESSGGGVAAVAQLLWSVFQSEWGSSGQLLTLIQGGSRTEPTVADKAQYALRLARAESLGRTDWVLFSHLALAKPQTAIPKRLQCPYAVFLHGIEVWNTLSPREYRILERADVLLANSHYTARRVMERYPEIGPVKPCPLALNVTTQAAVNDSDDTVNLPLGSHVVLTVGRMFSSERYKGHDQLIEAWPLVVARVPQAQLVIVGQGDDVERLRRKAAACSAADRIFFTGFISNTALDALYRRAAVFALPSRGEGFGLVYLEAMARRLACVGSIHDAAQDIIVDGKTGRLVDQADLEELANVLGTLLCDVTGRVAMGEAGYRRVHEHFSFERFRERFCEAVGVRSARQVALSA